MIEHHPTPNKLFSEMFSEMLDRLTGALERENTLMLFGRMRHHYQSRQSSSFRIGWANLQQMGGPISFSPGLLGRSFAINSLWNSLIYINTKWQPYSQSKDYSALLLTYELLESGSCSLVCDSCEYCGNHQ